VAAGAVVVGDVGAYELVAGVPARHVGWVSRHGARLQFGEDCVARCPHSGEQYAKSAQGVVVVRRIE
jgi:UDP-2-acetamido-3-amino-2,3-dideoxy-glucuronate N-acetyltransferase